MITSDDYEAERRRMAAKMRSEAGKEAYKKRKETVEWPFGNIKQNLKFREFLTRGIEEVRVEHNLVCTAHNLKVIWGKLERNVPIIGKIRTLVPLQEELNKNSTCWKTVANEHFCAVKGKKANIA